MMNTRVEMNEEMMEQVNGGSLWDDLCDTVDDMCKWVNEQVGEEIFHRTRCPRQKDCMM